MRILVFLIANFMIQSAMATEMTLSQTIHHVVMKMSGATIKEDIKTDSLVLASTTSKKSARIEARKKDL